MQVKYDVIFTVIKSSDIYILYESMDVSWIKNNIIDSHVRNLIICLRTH